MTSIIGNDRHLFIRKILAGLILAAIACAVISGFVIAMILSDRSQETTIVLQLPATIVLNRFIESYELPLFYNALDIMDIIVIDMKKLLNTTFEDKFVNLIVTYFSPTPNITKTTTIQTSFQIIDSTTENIITKSNTHKFNDIESRDPTTTNTIFKYSEIDYIENQNNQTTSIISNNSISRCNITNNTTGQSSIISLKMFLYFQIKNSETISIPEIIDTFQNLKPSIAVVNRCKESSSKTGSFNQMLSTIASSTQVNIDTTTLRNEENVPLSLKSNVTDTAARAIYQFKY
ncbi:unnamed protein product [Rotaria sordida]|uniref:Uncharacterized protein n=1 Tax=Rotaria sordida TaxID=392033 RepID=A0A820CD28_9BILA|nr:unnamed protein product [Rotaria sordida]